MTPQEKNSYIIRKSNLKIFLLFLKLFILDIKIYASASLI